MPAAQDTPDHRTVGRRKLEALFTITDIDENLRDLLKEKDGLFLHRAMIDYWLELRHQHSKRIARLAKLELEDKTGRS